MSSTVLDSIPNYAIKLPEIEDISVAFKYHYFTQGEGVYPASNDPTLSTIEQVRYGMPREVRIDLKGQTLNSLSPGDTFAQSLGDTELAQIFSAENFELAETEFELQAKPSSTIVFQPDLGLDRIARSLTVTDNVIDHYESLSTIVSSASPQVQKILEEVLASGAEVENNSAVMFDPTTNLPVAEFDNFTPEFSMNSTVRNSFIGDVVESVADNYLSNSGLRLAEFTATAKNTQNSIRRQHIAGQWNLNDSILAVNPIDYTPPETDGSTPLVQMGLIGIVAYKTRINGTTRTPEKPIVLVGRDKGEIVDTNVVYGATYEYSLRTIALVRHVDNVDTGGTGGLDAVRSFLLLSPEGAKCDVNCIEAKPPKTVSTIIFTFLQSSMRIQWTLPPQVSESGNPVNDIKYVQVFYRNSVDEAFKLYSMYDFNDSMALFPASETFPTSKIIFTTIHNNFIEVPLPDYTQPTIWAVCTVDAHGNSSNYSAQYRSSVDNLGNYTMEHVAYPGAPKQYPNLTLVEESAFVDSIKVSNCSSVDIYHNPTAVALLDNTGIESERLVAANAPLSATGEKMPTYRLQLIDLETQKDQIINFIIEEK